MPPKTAADYIFIFCHCINKGLLLHVNHLPGYDSCGIFNTMIKIVQNLLSSVMLCFAVDQNLTYSSDFLEYLIWINIHCQCVFMGMLE